MPRDEVKFLSPTQAHLRNKEGKEEEVVNMPCSALHFSLVGRPVFRLGQSAERWSHFSEGLCVSQDCWVLVLRQGAVHLSSPCPSANLPPYEKCTTPAFRSFSLICSFSLLNSLGSEDHRRMWSSLSGWNRPGTDASSAVCLLRRHSYTCFQPRHPGAWHCIQGWAKIGL